MKGEHTKKVGVYRPAGVAGPMRLSVCPTTGGKLELSVSPADTVEGLKRILARKLRVHEQRLNLLHKNRILVRGSLQDNHLSDGSHVTLLPNLATGTSTKMSPTDSRVMQALENLSDSQVSDFLTGRAPLLLAMKLGEHMMFVQLQLSTSSCSSRRRSAAPVHNHNVPNGVSAPSTGSELGSGAKPACCPPALANQSSLSSSGAMIDRVSHLGHGVYSGTFSGTLDPTIQERERKPKRDIDTILHILNDLLVASPQMTQQQQQQQQQHNMHHHANNSQHTGPSPCLNSGNSILRNKLEQLNQSESEDTALRGKVRHLQRMMEQRKLQRRSRRHMRAAPYHWTQKLSTIKPNDARNSLVNFEQPLSRDSVPKSEGHANSDAAFSGSSSGAIEQESVFV